jgi:hypothetical protein
MPDVPLSFSVVPGGNDPAVAPVGLHTSANVTLTSKVETVYVNTTGGPYTVTMPASPKNYEPKVFKDIGGGLSLEACEIDGNGHDIEQDDGTFASTYDMTEDRQVVAWRYSGTLGKWVRTSGAGGGGGGGGNLIDAYVNRPASGTVGQRFRPSDGGPAFVWDGTLWRPEFETRLGYEPPSAGWTAVDSGRGANVSFANGVLELASTSMAVGDAWSFAVRSFAGGAGDFDVRVRLRQVMTMMGSTEVVSPAWLVSGFVLRSSSSGQWTGLLAQVSRPNNSTRTTQVVLGCFNSATSWNNTPIVHDVHHVPADSHWWFRAAQVGTTLSLYTSNDGMRWWKLWELVAGSRMPTVPDQLGIGHNAYLASGSGSHDTGVRLESWEVA